MAAKKKKPTPRKASAWRQILFVKYYLENGGNGTQAMFLAGFKGTAKSAGIASVRMLANESVIALMEREKLEIQSMLNWKAEDSKKGLIVEAKKAEKPSDRIKALLGLAKIDGLMIEKQELTIKLSEEERQRRLIELVKIAKEKSDELRVPKEVRDEYTGIGGSRAEVPGMDPSGNK